MKHYICGVPNGERVTQNPITMNKATQDNIDVAILSGHMSSVEAYLEVKHPDSKAYIVKEHMDEELEMYLKEDSMTRQESINYKKRLMGAVCDAEEAIQAIQNAMDSNQFRRNGPLEQGIRCQV